MTPTFSVRTTPHYERLVQKLLRGQPDLQALQDQSERSSQPTPTTVHGHTTSRNSKGSAREKVNTG
jgi:hypothetical protein